MQIHLIVKETLKLLRASLPATIEICQNIDTHCGAVLADPTQMHQVIMNLCTNADHAMRERGGVLGVSLDVVYVDADFPGRVRVNLQEGTYLRLTVSDTGHGMDSATLERIFEPFFTTKAVDEGAGMGLATVHGIVTSHQGAITVYSEPGKGTTFHVYLPRLESPATQEDGLTPEPIPRGNERILFVDFDEAKTVFDDALYVDFYDPDHSYNEHRYIIIGHSQQGRLLIVSYTEQEDVIRLSSARKLTPGEREAYEEGY